MYAYVRTYTRTRRNFSDNESALQHYQTVFHHQSDAIHFYYPIAVQTISILEPHWLCHLYKLSASDIICHSFTSVFQLSTNRPSSRTYHIPSLSDFHSSQLTISSICQSAIKPCQFSIYYPHSHIQQFSHLIQITISINPTIIIFIMETVFRANHLQFLLCIIIHLLIFVMKFV